MNDKPQLPLSLSEVAMQINMNVAAMNNMYREAMNEIQARDKIIKEQAETIEKLNAEKGE